MKERSLQECHEIISKAIGQKPNTVQPKNELQELHQSLIDACLTESKKRLGKWEVDFLTSVADQLSNTGSLSEKQVEILERIYTEKV